MKVIYLSYDGMTDPLGRSQVIPYLEGLTRKGHEITLVSCEKPLRFRQSRDEVAELLKRVGIEWQPIFYHKKPPIFSTLWDLFSLRRKAESIVRRGGFEIVHCRSYLPSLVGLRLKHRYGLKFIFDMRGFWADERVDGGLWNPKHPVYGMIFRYFKRKELEFLNQADRIVSLTHAGKSEMQRWKISPTAGERIEVIPCCADLEHFKRTKVTDSVRQEWRQKLDLKDSDYVVTYLGSIGTWYMLEDMLRFFKQLAAARPLAKLLLITQDAPESIRDAARLEGLDLSLIRVQKATRSEVPALLSLSSLGLFFILPSYSKMSSSPTKMAEYLAMGIPIVTNSGVGDNEWIAATYPMGKLVSQFTTEAFQAVIDALPECERLRPEDIRAAAQSYFSLEIGVETYHRIYTSLS